MHKSCKEKRHIRGALGRRSPQTQTAGKRKSQTAVTIKRRPEKAASAGGWRGYVQHYMATEREREVVVYNSGGSGSVFTSSGKTI